jgi:NAD+ diphosphatase
MAHAFRFCPSCSTPLRPLNRCRGRRPQDPPALPGLRLDALEQPHAGAGRGDRSADRGGRVLLARNAAWSGRMFALITGFMEAGETPEEGIAREVAEETNAAGLSLSLIGVYDFQRMNQVIIAYHALARGEVRLSPELAEYKLYAPEDVRCWPPAPATRWPTGCARRGTSPLHGSAAPRLSNVCQPTHRHGPDPRNSTPAA